jgi:hypothetical protein
MILPVNENGGSGFGNRSDGPDTGSDSAEEIQFREISFDDGVRCRFAPRDGGESLRQTGHCRTYYCIFKSIDRCVSASSLPEKRT